MTACAMPPGRRSRALKRENGELKQLVAELSLEAYRLKKTVIPMPQDGVGIAG